MMNTVCKRSELVFCRSPRILYCLYGTAAFRGVDGYAVHAVMVGGAGTVPDDLAASAVPLPCRMILLPAITAWTAEPSTLR